MKKKTFLAILISCALIAPTTLQCQASADDNWSDTLASTFYEVQPDDSIQFTDNIMLYYYNSVNDDTTDKWRLILTESEFDIYDYMVEYHDAFIEDAENECVHCLICCTENEDNQISACINLTADSITVTVHEYVSGEAYSANDMFTGEYIKSRTVYTNTGEILDYDDSSATVYYATTKVNVRSSADTSSDVLEVLSSGDQVEVRSIIGDWAVISYNDSIAYVYSQYLTDTIPESETQAEQTEKQEQMVWIPNSGSKYHSRSSCSNMKNPTQVTISRAKQLGYEACKKCW